MRRVLHEGQRLLVLQDFEIPGHECLEFDTVEDMLSWKHEGGFSLDASVRIEGWDRNALERLARYCALFRYRNKATPSLLLRPAWSSRRAESGLQPPKAHPGRSQRPGDEPAGASRPTGRADPPTAHTPGQIFRSSRSERRLERAGDIIGRSISGPDGATLQCRRADGPAIRFGSRRQPSRAIARLRRP